MDINEVEQVDLEALGGTDLTTVNDPSGTDAEASTSISRAFSADARPMAQPTR